MLTFNDLRTEALSWLDESAAGTTASSYINVTNALKQAHTIRLTEDRWKFMLWPRFETFTTVSGQQTYALHQAFMRPYVFRNTTTARYLTETPARNYESTGIDYNTDTDTHRFELTSRTQIQTQPSSASVLTIVSTSASDNTAAKAIIVYGDTTSGLRSETITPNGTTPVAGSVSFTQILSVTKSAAWAGTLTITSNSGAVTNLVLFSDEYGRSYPQLQLLYLPTAGETIQYKFYRAPRELTNSNDITDIPPPFERVLIYDALLLMGAYDNRLDGGRIALWTRMKEELDFQMRQTFLEGQSIGSEPRFIREYTRSAYGMQIPD